MSKSNKDLLEAHWKQEYIDSVMIPTQERIRMYLHSVCPPEWCEPVKQFLLAQARLECCDTPEEFIVAFSDFRKHPEKFVGGDKSKVDELLIYCLRMIKIYRKED